MRLERFELPILTVRSGALYPAELQARSVCI